MDRPLTASLPVPGFDGAIQIIVSVVADTESRADLLTVEGRHLLAAIHRTVVELATIAVDTTEAPADALDPGDETDGSPGQQPVAAAPEPHRFDPDEARRRAVTQAI